MKYRYKKNIITTKNRIKNTFKNINRKYIVFMIFVLISSLLWLVNALSKNYITDIEIPINYINIPSNYTPINKIPQKAHLQVNGQGFTLLKYTLGTRYIPLNIDLKRYFKNKKTEETTFTYYMLNDKKKLEDNMNHELKILDILPQTITLSFDKLKEKNVKIVPKLDIKYSKQYRQKDKLTIIPKITKIYGPKNILDTLKSINTSLITDENVSSDKEYSIKLVNPKFCNTDIKKVKVNLKVEQFTENTIDIPIKVINKPDSVSVSIFPEKISIQYLISLGEFKNITAKSFDITVNYNDMINKVQNNKLDIKLFYIPEQVQIKKYWPHQVKYMINK